MMFKQTEGSKSGPVRLVEGSREGRPERVYHRFNRETWVHTYLHSCDICTKVGETVKRRQQRLAAFDKAHALALEATPSVSPSAARPKKGSTRPRKARTAPHRPADSGTTGEGGTVSP